VSADSKPGPYITAGPVTRSGFADSLALLFTRRYGTYVFATLLSNLGTWAQQVAEPWLLLNLGASSMLLGVDTFAQSAPVWLLTLLGGVLADRADRRRVIFVCQSIQALCPLTLVVLLLAGQVSPWMVIASSLVVGVTDALSMPSFQSIVPTIVERSQIASALALNATQFNLSRILGPALAGVLMGSLGIVACFAANTLSYIPFIMIAIWILPRGRAADPDEMAGERVNPLAGLDQIARNRYLGGGLLTVLVTSFLCGPLIIFCPVLVRDALQGDIGEFSMALGAFGFGGLLGAVVLLGIGPNRDRRPLGSGLAVAYGAVTAMVAVSPWLWALPVLLAAGGGAMSVSNTSVNTLLQASAPSQLRGRTVSLYMLAMRGGLSLGGLLTGASVQVFGIRHALLINGCAAMLTHLIIGRLWCRAPAPGSAPRGE
jgi:MFS family permease